MFLKKKKETNLKFGKVLTRYTTMSQPSSWWDKPNF